MTNNRVSTNKGSNCLSDKQTNKPPILSDRVQAHWLWKILYLIPYRIGVLIHFSLGVVLFVIASFISGLINEEGKDSLRNQVLKKIDEEHKEDF